MAFKKEKMTIEEEILKRVTNIEAILFKAFTNKDFSSIIAQVTKRYDTPGLVLNEDTENSQTAVPGNEQLRAAQSGDVVQAGTEGEATNGGTEPVAGEPEGSTTKND